MAGKEGSPAGLDEKEVSKKTAKPEENGKKPAKVHEPSKLEKLITEIFQKSLF